VLIVTHYEVMGSALAQKCIQKCITYNNRLSKVTCKVNLYNQVMHIKPLRSYRPLVLRAFAVVNFKWMCHICWRNNAKLQ